MPNKKISQLDVRTSPTLADLLAIADPSTGYAYKITGTNLQTVLEIPNKVPYTGATANVNLGSYSITATNIIRAGGLATQFLKADGSVDITTYMNRAVYDTDGNGVVDAAEKMQTIGRNSTGVTLYKGTIVYISGSTGNRPNFVKAQANSEATSAGTFGVVVADIANNSDGYVATIGTLADLDTRTTATNPFTSVTLADGDTLYLDPNTAGYVTNVKPSAPNHIVYVGKVVRTSPTLGTIVYRIQNGYELNEIHDVSISSVANNDVLVYESSSTLWKNKSIATILGYTPANDSLVVHLAGAENITGVKTFQNALQTTAGNNLLNTGGGNTVIGYTADPASSATYKLDVNGATRITGYLNATAGYLQVFDNDAIYVNNNATSNGRIKIFGANTAIWFYTGGVYRGAIGSTNTSMQLTHSGGVGIGANSDLFVNSSGSVYINAASPNASAKFEIVSTTSGFLMPRMTTAQKNLISGPVTSLMVYDTDLATFQYYTGSAWAGLGGATGSGAAGQVTYWSGSSSIAGSNNLYWDNTNVRLGIGTNSVADRLAIKGDTTFASIALETTGYATKSYIGNYQGKFYQFGSNRRIDGTISNASAAVAYVNVFVDNNVGHITLVATNTNNIDGNSVLRAWGSGNVTIQNGGVYNDSGHRLQVTGSMRIGSTAASALYWDDTNNRLQIGSTTPTTTYQRDFVISKSGAGITAAAAVYNSSTTGNAGIYIGEDNSNFVSLVKYGSAWSGSWAGTTLAAANAFQIGAGSSNNLQIALQGNPIVLAPGTTSTNIGLRNDTTSVRITTLANIHTSGTALLDVDASTTARASFRIRSGTAPTSPNEGDIWQDGTNIKIYIGGSTKTFTII